MKIEMISFKFLITTIALLSTLSVFCQQVTVPTKRDAVSKQPDTHSVQLNPLSGKLDTVPSKSDYKNLSFVYTEDLIVGEDAFWLGVKEVFEDNRLFYHFVLKTSDDQNCSFTLEDIQPSERTAQVLSKRLIASWKNLSDSTTRAISEEDAAKMNKMAELPAPKGTLSTEEEPPLTDDEKDFIEQTLTNAAQSSSYNERILRSQIKSLLNARSNSDDSLWIEKKISNASTVKQERARTTIASFKSLSSNFLFKLYTRLLALNQTAPNVGTIYVNSEIDVHTLLPPTLSPKDSCKISRKEAKKKRKEIVEHKKGNVNVPEVKGVALDTTKYKQEPSDTVPIKKIEYTPDALIVEEVVIEFENNQIANIKVEGRLKSNLKQFLVFQNRVPISYSTKADVSQDFHGLKRKAIALFTTTKSYGDKYIKFSEIFYNDYELLLTTENYSPVDTVISLKPQQKGYIIRKEKVTEIFQAKVFSDFVGLGEESPNGLVQTELSKKFFLDTRIIQSGVFGSGYAYYGWFNYFAPRIVAAKLEENNKFINLNQDSAIINNLDAFRYTNLIVGGTFNVYHRGHPKKHSSIYFDLGLDLHRTGVALGTKSVMQDSSGNIQTLQDQVEFNINSLSVFPEIIFNINPHPNYRISFNYRWRFFNILDNRVKQAGAKSPFISTQNSIHSFGFIAAVKFQNKSSSEVFFRAGFNFDHKDINNNFFQAQVGYSFNIFSRPAERSETRTASN